MLCKGDSNSLHSIAILCVLVILIIILCHIAVSIETFSGLVCTHTGIL